MNDPRGQCLGKTRYPSPQAAHAQVRRVGKRKTRAKRSGGPWPYKCDLCGSWHVGQPKG